MAILVVIICLIISGSAYDSGYRFLGIGQAGWLSIVFGAALVYAVGIVVRETP